MKDFQIILKQDFVNALNNYSEGWTESTQGKEYVYKHILSNKTYMLVYSSVDIKSDESRGLGEDAIRCVLYDSVSNKPLGKAVRTHRVKGWENRLQDKLQNLEELSKTSDYPRCSECFSVMLKRTNKKTGKSFLGCSSYPDFCGGSRIHVRSSRIMGYLNALPDEIPESVENIAEETKSNKAECWIKIIERYEYLSTIAWLKSRIRNSEVLLNESNRLFELLEAMRSLNTDEVSSILEHKPLNDSVIRDLVHAIKNWNTELTTPKPNKIETHKATPLGMNEKVDLAPTESFPYMRFDFEYFNPAQTIALPYIDNDCNIVVAAPTASGKTVVAEMVIARALERGEKSIYLAPMKALAEEKYADFTSKTHHFSDYNLSVMSGDYTLTTAKQRELQNANIIIMTNEMLATRSRMASSEKNEWLNDVGCLLVDEAHLIGITGRGDATESAMMIFSKLNPKSRLILLSATLPNCIEMARWVQVLNRKETALVESDYRPCKIEKHYLRVPHYNNYQSRQYERLKIISGKLQELGFS